MPEDFLFMKNKKFLESSASSELTDFPSAEKSYVRLIPQAAQKTRHELSGVFNGRFPHMYALERATHNYFGLEAEDGPEFPSIEQAASAFSDEDLLFSKAYQKPSLILCPPGRTRDDLFSIAINHDDSCPMYAPKIYNSDNVHWCHKDQYRAFIVEGADHIIPYDDRLVSPLIKRLKHKERTYEGNEWGMSGEVYALLGMQSIVRGSPIDKMNYTILDGESVVAGRFVPVGRFRDEAPVMEWLPSGKTGEGGGRFRRVIGGRFIDPAE